jgi:ribosome-binding protein aMBF1 (putative translation factor)
MKTFDSHLKKLQKKPKFKELYEQEKVLLDFSLRLQEARQKAELSQKPK